MKSKEMQQFICTCAKCRKEFLSAIIPPKGQMDPVEEFKTKCPRCGVKIILRFETVDKEAAKK